MSTEQAQARDRIISTVLRRLSSERADPSAHYDAELEYCDDMLLDAARALVAAEEGSAADHLNGVLAEVVMLDSDPNVPHKDLGARLVSLLVARIEKITGERPDLPWEPPGVAAAMEVRPF